MQISKKYRISDLTEIIGGGTPKTSVSEYWNGNISWLSVIDFCGDQKKVYKTEKTITRKGLDESSTKVLRKGQLIISARGTVGELAMLGKDMAFNQSCYGLNAIQHVTTNDFLYYLLKFKLDEIKRHTHGAVFDTITKQTFQQIEVTLPDLPTQTRIASILSSLDDKIELNRRMNQTLEQMAQALFNHYFVDNIDKDNLPKGWRWGKLGEICFQSKDSINPTKIDKTFEHYSIPAFDTQQKPTKDYGASILSNKFIVKSNSILFSKLNPRFPRIWLINDVDESVSICSTEFLVFIPIEKYNWCFTFLQLSQKEIIDNLIGKASGTSGSHQRIRPDDILELDILIPSSNKLIEFQNEVSPMLLKRLKNIHENNSLSQIRDTLLPKLMSGEIDVDKEMDKEEIIENQLTNCKTA